MNVRRKRRGPLAEGHAQRTGGFLFVRIASDQNDRGWLLRLLSLLILSLLLLLLLLVPFARSSAAAWVRSPVGDRGGSTLPGEQGLPRPRIVRCAAADPAAPPRKARHAKGKRADGEGWSRAGAGPLAMRQPGTD